MTKLLAWMTLAFSGAPLSANNTIFKPVHPVVEVRLQSHLSSYASRSGDVVRGIVIAPVKQNGYILIPRGSIVYGRVRKASPVGYGVARERAGLDLEWLEWEHPDGTRHRLDAQLMDIDNAREHVTNKGRVTGILAAGGAPGFMLGMWRWPEPSMLARTAGGLAGLSYFMLEKVPFTPLSIAGIITMRFIVVRWPEPEIHFAPGTEMLLSLLETPASASEEKERELPVPPEQLVAVASKQSYRTTRARSLKPADITNFLFVGTREQVTQGFLLAGWSPSEPLNRGSGMRIIRAATAQRGYPTAPMSKLLLDGKAPDMMFQKSLNTLSKRHHIRIWQSADTYEGNPVWVGAATHDTGIRLHGIARGFTHQIDPFVDRERRKVINDLNFAGCVEQTHIVDRPNIAHLAMYDIVTDGGVAALNLKDCAPVDSASWGEYPPPPAQGSLFKGFTRRLILEGRHALMRGNIYYWGYRMVREGVMLSREQGTPSLGKIGLLPID